jgi:hypothetical protein
MSGSMENLLSKMDADGGVVIIPEGFIKRGREILGLNEIAKYISNNSPYSVLSFRAVDGEWVIAYVRDNKKSVLGEI